MKAVVIYDSAFGNTAKVATAIADALTPFASIKKCSVGDTDISYITESDIVFLGSPTQGGRPTQTMMSFLDQLPDNCIYGKLCAVFDTRFRSNAHGPFLKLLMKSIGFAAPKMARSIQAKGGVLLEPIEGFIVTDKEGPLEKNELSRAFRWAQQTCAQARSQQQIKV